MQIAGHRAEPANCASMNSSLAEVDHVQNVIHRSQVVLQIVTQQIVRKRGVVLAHVQYNTEHVLRGGSVRSGFRGRPYISSSPGDKTKPACLPAHLVATNELGEVDVFDARDVHLQFKNAGRGCGWVGWVERASRQEPRVGSRPPQHFFPGTKSVTRTLYMPAACNQMLLLLCTRYNNPSVQSLTLHVQQQQEQQWAGRQTHTDTSWQQAGVCCAHLKCACTHKWWAAITTN